MTVEFLNNLLSKLPLYSQGLSWFVPALIGLFLGTLISLAKGKLKSPKLKSTLN